MQSKWFSSQQQVAIAAQLDLVVLCFLYVAKRAAETEGLRAASLHEPPIDSALQLASMVFLQ